MPEKLLLWGPKEAQAYGHANILGHHRLSSTGLFSQERLLKLIETHPRERLFVHTMGHDLQKPQEWRTGDYSQLSPQELMGAVEKGRFWLNILEVQKFHDDYRELITQIYRELEELCPGLRTFHHSANVLISSPSAMVYYHADAPPNILWHMQGKKRVWVYPAHDERFATQESLEKVFSRERNEDLPYSPAFDRFAEVYDLEPGQVLTWPQNGPHRVQNLEGVNVSLSTEHYTSEAQKREWVYAANRFFRSSWHLPTRSTSIDGPAAHAKTFLFRALRKLKMKRSRHYVFKKTFKVVPSAQNAMIDIEPMR